MSTVNLLPEDYLERRCQQRANVLCLALFSVVMAGVVGAAVVSERQARQTRQVREQINREYESAGKLITQLQQLEARKKDALAKAQVAGELRERVLRSYLLASLTNAMPEGVTLRSLNLTTQSLREPPKPSTSTTKFQSRGVKNKSEEPPPTAPSEMRVQIDIIGLAKTDVQVAQFITNMTASPLTQAVDLEYSEQAKYMEVIVREFKVTVVLKPDARIEGELQTASGPLSNHHSALASAIERPLP